jgi:hypothetical protein
MTAFVAQVLCDFIVSINGVSAHQSLSLTDKPKEGSGVPTKYRGPYCSGYVKQFRAIARR